MSRETVRQQLREATDFAAVMRVAARGEPGLAALDRAWAEIDAAGVRLTHAQRAWRRFWRVHRHLFARATPDWPAERIVFQAAIDYAEKDSVTRSAERWLKAGKVTWPWLRRVHRPAAPEAGPLVRIVEHPLERPSVVALDGGACVLFQQDSANDALFLPLADVRTVPAPGSGRGGIAAIIPLSGSRWASLAKSGEAVLWQGAERVAGLGNGRDRFDALYSLGGTALAARTTAGGLIHFAAASGERRRVRLPGGAKIRHLTVFADGSGVIVAASGEMSRFAPGLEHVERMGAVAGVADAGWCMSAAHPVRTAVLASEESSRLVLIDSITGTVRELELPGAGWKTEAAGHHLIAFQERRIREIDLRTFAECEFDLSPTDKDDFNPLIAVRRLNDDAYLATQTFYTAKVLRRAHAEPIAATQLRLPLTVTQLSAGRAAAVDHRRGRVELFDREGAACGTWMSPFPSAVFGLCALPGEQLGVSQRKRFVLLDARQFGRVEGERPAHKPVREAWALATGDYLSFTPGEPLTLWDGDTDGGGNPAPGSNDVALEAAWQLGDGTFRVLSGAGDTIAVSADGLVCENLPSLDSLRKDEAQAQLVKGTHLVYLLPKRGRHLATIEVHNVYSRKIGRRQLPGSVEKVGFAGAAHLWMFEKGALYVSGLGPRETPRPLAHLDPGFKPRFVFVSGANVCAGDRKGNLVVWELHSGRRLWSLAVGREMNPKHLRVRGEQILLVESDVIIMADRRRGVLSDWQVLEAGDVVFPADDRAAVRLHDAYWVWDGDQATVVTPLDFQRRFVDLAAMLTSNNLREQRCGAGAWRALPYAGGCGLFREGATAPAAVWHGLNPVVPRLLLADGNVAVDDGEGRLIRLQPWNGSRPARNA